MPHSSSCCTRFQMAARDTSSAAASSSPECSCAVREQTKQLQASAHGEDLRGREQPEPLHARFGARAYAREVAAVGEGDEQCHRERKGKQCFRFLMQQPDRDRNRHGGSRRRESHESEEHHGREPGCDRDREQDRCEREQRARQRRATLAAAKSEEYRPDMTRNGTRGAAGCQPVARDRGVRRQRLES